MSTRINWSDWLVVVQCKTQQDKELDVLPLNFSSSIGLHATCIRRTQFTESLVFGLFEFRPAGAEDLFNLFEGLSFRFR